uniref:Apple domain-containing protein n=1 Tax=Caenorhabditis japonica TaxID=281687 RepID=A0A8R1IME4_CAEJA
DPCFRRYENSIIVNAQPYERRSSTGLMHCKSHCLNSQIGVYSCRSFVYDNVNRVCDLFAHVGDQSPSRLLKFQTRDYFEPTDIIHCLSLTGESPDATSTITSLEDDSPPSPPPTDSTNTIDKREDMIEDDITSTTPTKALEWRPNNEDCPRGKQPTYLRTEGFELFKHDDSRMTVQSVEECARACTENNIDGSRLNCKSFDFEPNTSTCYFTSEAAVPVGNGQLKQRDDVSYHEKICVNKHFVE